MYACGFLLAFWQLPEGFFDLAMIMKKIHIHNLSKLSQTKMRFDATFHLSSDFVWP